MADPQDSEEHHPPDHYMEDPTIRLTDLAHSPDAASDVASCAADYQGSDAASDAASCVAEYGSDNESPLGQRRYKVKTSLRYISGEQVLPSTGPTTVFIDEDANIGQCACSWAEIYILLPTHICVS